MQKKVQVFRYFYRSVMRASDWAGNTPILKLTCRRGRTELRIYRRTRTCSLNSFQGILKTYLEL
jgi:hypothetical protein